MRRIAVIALAALLAPCLSARAGLILSIESTTVQANSTGNSFDVTLTNTGPSTVIGILSFKFIIQASNGNISFDNTPAVVTTSTTEPYIFAGHSLLGPDIGGSTATEVGAGDDYSPGAGFDLASGATVGLGHVLFNAGPASGITLLSFIPGLAGNTFVDVGGQLPQLTLNTGTITVAPFTATPEPSSLAMAGGAVLIGGGAWWRKRRRSVNA
jgi:hypothetical protein